jgi:hypothetical protein
VASSATGEGEDFDSDVSAASEDAGGGNQAERTAFSCLARSRSRVSCIKKRMARLEEKGRDPSVLIGMADPECGKPAI